MKGLRMDEMVKTVLMIEEECGVETKIREELKKELRLELREEFATCCGMS